MFNIEYNFAIMNLKMVVVRLKELLEERNLTLYRVQADTGIAYTTLLKMAHNKNKSVDLKILGKLCDYLKCQLTDILEYQPKKTA